MDEDLLHLWLGMFPNILNSTMGKILDFFGGAENLWYADERDIKDNLTEKQSNLILKSRDENRIKEYKKRLNERGISYIYPEHEYFPEALKNIPDCPRLLYARGRINELNKGRTGIAIVGARKASLYGRRTAELFAKELSYYNTEIISGMALGIDSKAHEAALENPDGFTIAVLGCGINVCYPRENYEQYQMIKRRGVILSEYGLDVPPDAWRFPLRNRIISGLSTGVIVIEAKTKSGSLITADQALEQGRDVYAVPGRIDDVNSMGCNNLIKQGAICVTSPEDVINELELVRLGEKPVDELKKKIKPLSDEEKRIYLCMNNGPIYVESICQMTGIDASRTLEILFDLEKYGIIKQPEKGYFVKS